MSNEWGENFKGKCITCHYATNPTKKMMVCDNEKAICRGLRFSDCFKGSGNKLTMGVHRLYGCVYWTEIDEKTRNGE